MHAESFVSPSIRRATAAAALTLVAVLGSTAARAATVAIGPGATLAPSYVTLVSGVEGAGDVYAPAVPGSYNYSYGFGPGAGATPVAGDGTAGFYVSYLITIDGAVANSLTSTIDLGQLLQISGLQSRLYSYDTNPGAPVTGVPAGGAVVGWTTPLSGGVGGLVTVIDNATLAPGSYVLQLRGTVTGSSGGSFGGVLNLAPVPLPAAAWLLMSGVLGLGAVARRRARA